MKKALLIFLLLPLFAFPQSEKRYRSIIIDSVKALNNGLVNIKDTAEFDLPVSIGGADDKTALLTLTSTTQGFLAPRLTTVQRLAIVSPTTGLLVFDTDLTAYFFFSGPGGWKKIGNGTPITLDVIPKGTGTDIVDGTWSFATNTLQPVTDGSNIGVTATNRIGTIFMDGSATIDYATTLLFKEAGSERMRILTGGNVGIDQSTPSEKFHLSGGNILVDRKTATSGINRTITIGGTISNAEFATVNFQNFNLLDAAPIDYTAAKIAGFSSNINDGELRFYTNDASTLNRNMTIDKNGNVAISGSTPAASAVLDVVSTTKGFLPPRMTSAQKDAIASPASGLIVYDNTTDEVNYFDGTDWKPLTTMYSLNASTQSFVSTTTLADVTGLSVSIEANKSYHVKVLLFMSVGAGGIKAGLNGPAGFTSLHYVVQLSTGVGFSVAGIHSAYNSTTGEANDAVFIVEIHGIIINGGTAGTVIARAAQQTSNAASSDILRDSFILLEEIN